MSKVDEKMLEMVANIATEKGRMETKMEEAENRCDELLKLLEKSRQEVEKYKRMVENMQTRIGQLEAKLDQEMDGMPEVVVNQISFFMTQGDRPD